MSEDKEKIVTFILKSKASATARAVQNTETYKLVVKQSDEIYEIPMSGNKESFNVSVAAGIALYQLTK